MLKYEDVVNVDNVYLVFSCKMKDASEKLLQVQYYCNDSIKPNYVFYNFEDVSDSKEYTEKDIDEIIGQVHFDVENNDQNYDSFECMDFEAINEFEIQPNVYAFYSKKNLEFIINSLNNPIIVDSNLGVDAKHSLDANKVYIDNLETKYGVLYYYTEYDDFSCYGDGFTHYIKIISGVL